MIEIKQPLKFYSTNGQQLRYRNAKEGSKNMYPLYVSRTALMPFILQREKDMSTQALQYTKILPTSIIATNILTNATYDITANITFRYAVLSTNPEVSTGYDFALYKGDSVISALPQGLYEIAITDSAGNTFYSETFKIWFPTKSVKFEYRNSFSFNNHWFFGNDFFFHMAFETVTIPKGEYDEYLATENDRYEHTYKTEQRKDEIFTVPLIVDENVYSAIQIMEMCDTVYLTDELGIRNKIDITGVNVEDIIGNNLQITIDYRIPANMLTRTSQNIQFIGESIGTAPKAETSGVWRGRAKIHRGNKKVTR